MRRVFFIPSCVRLCCCCCCCLYDRCASEILTTVIYPNINHFPCVFDDINFLKH